MVCGPCALILNLYFLQCEFKCAILLYLGLCISMCQRHCFQYHLGRVGKFYWAQSRLYMPGSSTGYRKDTGRALLNAKILAKELVATLAMNRMIFFY